MTTDQQDALQELPQLVADRDAALAQLRELRELLDPPALAERMRRGYAERSARERHGA